MARKNKVVIDREKWKNGDTFRYESSLLENSNGNRCCLGFLSLAAIPDCDIVGMPGVTYHMENKASSLKFLHYKVPVKFLYYVLADEGLRSYVDFKRAILADYDADKDFNYHLFCVIINDQKKLSQNVRERLITTIFNHNHWDVEFVGEYQGI